jgi:general stress protein YciG
MTTKPRGFALISPERRREISRMGGKAAHEAGTAHEFTQEEARAAGRKGGMASHPPRKPKTINVDPGGTQTV